MKRKLITFIVVFLLCLNTVYIAECATKNKITLYVSQNGDDKFDGTAQEPLKTLNGAKLKLRQLRNGDTTIPAEVVFSEGTYRFFGGADFYEMDSGTQDAPVVYRAKQGEKVQFKGSIPIDTSKGIPVTDKAILGRMYSTVRDKIVQIDLKQQNFPYDLPKMDTIAHSNALYHNLEYLNLYLDDKEQMISQWPNGDDTHVKWTSAIDNGLGNSQSGGTIQYSGNQPERWTNADSWWIGGYPGYDYRYERNSISAVDVNKKTITFATPTDFGIISQQSKSWKAYNLLEEIDLPGEWYADRNTMMLYYYPPYTLKNANLEISSNKNIIVYMLNASNISFEGIEFSQNRDRAFVMTNVKNIIVENCVFRNLDRGAIYVSGTQMAKTDNFWWQNMAVNGASNCLFQNNSFENIGAQCIELSGGNVDTLEPGNNIIQNNFFWRCSTKIKNAEVIRIYGVGNSILHNNISSTSFHAITYFGNDHKIMYNEIFNVNKNTNDVGAIYTGRNYLSRGIEIAYNYLHDLDPVDKTMIGHNSALYWDDSACGQNAHHNIIVNSSMPASASGQDNHWTDNVTVNSNLALHFANTYEGSKDRINRELQQTSSLPNPDLYFAHYPNAKKGITDEWLAKNAFNVMTGNLTVNSASVDIGSSVIKYGTVKNNVTVSQCNDFVDPENQDYRIKKKSETAKQLPGLLNEEFDLEQIGINNAEKYIFNEETSPFRLTYPQNGNLAVNAAKVDFTWENALGANQYRVVVATDPELNNVVYDEIHDYNIATVKNLDSGGKRYYWKVYAINTSREFSSTWKSDGTVYMFKTSIYDVVDTSALSETIKNAQAEMENITEGNENGYFAIGTKAALAQRIKEAKIYVNAKMGACTQKQINNKIEEIESCIKDSRILNRGYMNIGKFITDKRQWGGDEVSIDENKASISKKNGESLSGIDGLKYYTNDCILCFKAKINTENWNGIGLNYKVGGQLYSPGNPGYYFVFKKDKIEFQKNSGSVSVVAEKPWFYANDGKFHNFEFGILDLKAGKLVILKIDGESFFEYMDIDDTAIKQQFVFDVTTTYHGTTELMPADSLPNQSAYNQLIGDYKLKAARQIYQQYVDVKNLCAFKIDSKTVITKDGFEDLSFASPTLVDGVAFVPAVAMAKILGAQATYENGEVKISAKGELFTFISNENYYLKNGEKIQMNKMTLVKNDTVMIPARELVNALNKELLWDSRDNQILIADSIGLAVMNETKLLKRTADIIDLLNDVILNK